MKKEKKSLDYTILSPYKDLETSEWATLKTHYKYYAEDLKKYTNIKVDDAPYESEDENDPFTYVVVKDGPTNIGFIGFSTYPGSFSRHDLYINGMYVREEYRRRGYGTKIAEDILKAAEFQSRDITMEILPANQTANEFWKKVMEKNGYEERLSFADLSAKRMGGDMANFYYYMKKHA